MIGYKGKVYYKSSPLTAAPDESGWTTLNKVRDVNLGRGRTEVESGDRDSDWEANEVGKRKSTVTMQLKYDPTDAGYLVLDAADANGTPVALAFIDGSGDIDDGGRGLAGNWVITDMPHPQPLDGLMVVDVTLRPNSHMGPIT